jgi:hypothetical protein
MDVSRLESLFSYGPALLAPSAWIVTALSVRSVVGQDAVVVMHAVMVLFISGFLAFGWRRMSDGLEVWRAVLAFGLVFTVLGLAGFLFDIGALTTIVPELGYWLLAPALASVYTGGRMEDSPLVLAGGVVSLLAGAVALHGIFMGSFLVVGLGGKVVGDFVSLAGAISSLEEK